MKRISATVWLWILCAVASAQLPPPDAASTRSVSGQFTVYGPRQASPPDPVSELGTNAQFMRLEPALLAVSCERIKQELWRELGVNAPWRGRIELALHSAQSSNEAITVVSERFTDGWNYHVELPDTIERTRFVRLIVQVLLIEYANRQAVSRSAEIPTWLAEGLSQQLTASREMELVLTPPRQTVNGFAVSRTSFEGHRTDPLEPARRQLRDQPPLTLEGLSWPAEEQLTGAAGGIYRCSAQLFVSELLRLNDGRACLRAMLEALPRCYNWQTAFLFGFRSHFERQLDVEKWWALQVAHFAGRDQGQTWTLEESWNKLDEIVCTPVRVQTSAVKLPAHAIVSLETIIRNWSGALQTQAFRGKLRDLELARVRMSQELAGLVDEYHEVLAAYLQQIDPPRSVRDTARLSRAAIRRVAKDTLQKLYALEVRRQALRPGSNPASAIESQPSPVSAP
jgi:hypothetical protein